jgi:hypothetical protein
MISTTYGSRRKIFAPEPLDALLNFECKSDFVDRLSDTSFVVD